MASLKDLKNRIGSVKNTQKITKAMKMVAASKLRRAREAAEAARPYAQKMADMVESLSQGKEAGADAPILLAGTGGNKKHLILVATADRGLCGGFNATIAKAVREKTNQLQREGKEVGLFFIGKKGRDALKTEFGHLEVGLKTDIAKSLNYEFAREISSEALAIFVEQEFDVCHLVYNRFVSAISQVVKTQQLIPLDVQPTGDEKSETVSTNAAYEYEPDEETILNDVLPKNLAMQVFRALLENAASEQGARMTAMDNATRNAGDRIKDLTLIYNRTRQAAITKELIEIISGAEAV